MSPAVTPDTGSVDRSGVRCRRVKTNSTEYADRVSDRTVLILIINLSDVFNAAELPPFSRQHGVQESSPLQIRFRDSVRRPAAEAPPPVTCHPPLLLCQRHPSATPSPPLHLALQTPRAAPEVSVGTRLPAAALLLGGTSGGSAAEAALHPAGIRRRRRLHR